MPQVFWRSIYIIFIYFLLFPAAEAHVPCSPDWRLSPERVGQDQPDHLPVHPRLRPVPEHSSFSSSEMVVEVGEKELDEA